MISKLLFIVLTLALVSLATAVDMESPDGEACWSSPTAIFLSEIQLTFTPGADLVRSERKYELCSDTVYRVALIPGTAPDVSDPIQYPLIVVLPNFHLFCESNCTLELAIAATPAVIVPTSALAQGAGLVPPGFRPSADNLIIDGFTFRNPNGEIYEDAVGIITLQGPAQNVTIRNCNFQSVGRSGWAIATEYYLAESVAVNRTEPLYQSVTIEDCTFQDSVFDRAAVIGFGVDGTPPVEDWPSNRVTLRRSIFSGNVNDGAAGTADFLGLLSFDDFVEVVMEDVCFDDNQTPSGSLIEVKNLESTVTGVYGGGTSVFSGNATDEFCIDGTLLARVDDIGCVPTDGSFAQCPLAEATVPTMAPQAMGAITAMPVEDTAGPTDAPIVAAGGRLGVTSLLGITAAFTLGVAWNS
eukprot:scaffold4267_cov168-Amphora_coffeaeformis.AAC.1